MPQSRGSVPPDKEGPAGRSGSRASGKSAGDASLSRSAAVRIERLKNGDTLATEEVWQKYFTRLARLAQRRLGGVPRRAADEEDVALSAMHSFVARARAGGLPQLAGESDLWRLLVTITARKVGALKRKHFAARRGTGKVRGESVFERPDQDGVGIGAVMSQEPTPQFAAQVADQCRELLDALADDTLREIALWKMEGWSNEEIAEKLGRNLRTVERKLSLIRDIWTAKT